MKYLIAGLGNVGDEYTETRHNIGFKIVEALADEAGASFISDRLASICEIKIKGTTHPYQANNIHEPEWKGN